MQHRLTVAADHVDGGGGDAGGGDQPLRRFGVAVGELGDDRRIGRLGRPPEEAAQPRPEGGGIGQGQGVAAPGDGPAVGDDEGGVDPVEGGSAHQPDGDERPGLDESAGESPGSARRRCSR